MAKARKIPGLEPQTRFGDAAASTVEVRAAEVFVHAEGVLDVSEIERVHDMRVATRRLRAALEVFAACFPSKEHGRALKEVKRLADALGERRDPDVAIEELEGISAELGGARGLSTLIEELRGEQERGNARLAAALDRILDQRLAELLADLAKAARP
jgi:CHAD domain-containing protein